LRKQIEQENKKLDNQYAQNAEMENQETHNKTILRKEIHDLKELLVTKEKE
jgi:hypothetical protein